MKKMLIGLGVVSLIVPGFGMGMLAGGVLVTSGYLWIFAEALAKGILNTEKIADDIWKVTFNDPTKKAKKEEKKEEDK